MVPIHPQACPGQPGRLRWLLPAGLLSFTGTPTSVPQEVASLLRDGTLAEVHVESGAVVTVLGAGRNWPSEGPRVRSALHAALADPDGWTTTAGVRPADDGVRPAEGGVRPADDDGLRVAAAALLDGQVGDFARSHGGSIELVGAHQGVVTVKLAGACHGCPAARHTLRQRLEGQLRRLRPDLEAVVEAGRRPSA
jgi:Fe-S cluster biogenesis protein NfuA